MTGEREKLLSLYLVGIVVLAVLTPLLLTGGAPAAAATAGNVSLSINGVGNQATITVDDADLNTDPGTTQSVNVTIESDTEPVTNRTTTGIDTAEGSSQEIQVARTGDVADRDGSGTTNTADFTLLGASDESISNVRVGSTFVYVTIEDAGNSPADGNTETVSYTELTHRTLDADTGDNNRQRIRTQHVVADQNGDGVIDASDVTLSNNASDETIVNFSITQQGTADVTIEDGSGSSDSGTETVSYVPGETVTLTETGSDTGSFTGTIPIAQTDSDGVLHARDGDEVTAFYWDDGGSTKRTDSETLSLPTTYLNGTVTDSDGNPVAGQSVNFEYGGTTNSVGSTTTDATGNYSFAVPDTDRKYDVIVNNQTHPLSETTNVSVTSGQTTTVDVALTEGGFIMGTVTDGNGSVGGVQVLFINATKDTVNRSVTTDANGEYNASLTAPGIYDVIIENSSYQFELVPQTQVRTGQTTNVYLALQPEAGNGYINGTVRDSNGTAVTDASVFAAESAYTDYGNDSVDNAGGYSMNVREGTYTVRVTAPGHPPTVVRNVNVTEDQSTQLPLTLQEPGFINGTVTAPAGSSVASTFVMVETGTTPVTGTVNASTGEYNITVPPGTHSVTVMSPNGTASSKEASVSAGSVNETSFSLLNTTIVHQSVEITEGPGNEANLGMRSRLIFGLLQVKLVDEGNSSIPAGQVGPPSEIEALGVDGTTTVRIDLTVQNFTAKSLLWGLDHARWNTSTNASVTNGTDITITGSPTTIQANTNRNLGPLLQKDPSQIQWSTGRNDRATTGFDQTVYIALFDLGNLPTEFRTSLKGMTVTTNAQTYSIPRVVNDTLQVWVAAPTKTVNGTDHNGFYQAEIPQAQLDRWGVTDPASELAALYKGDPADFTVTDTSDGARIRIENISYSAGYVEVQADPSDGDVNNEASTGGGGVDPPGQTAERTGDGVAFRKVVRDEAPDDPGTTVRFEAAEIDGMTRSPPVRSITFDRSVATSERIELADVVSTPDPTTVGTGIDTVLRTFEIKAPRSVAGTSATITFTVPQSALGNRDPGDVRLAKQREDGSWRIYPASPIDPSADPARFRSRVDGFSRWSIVIQRSIDATPAHSPSPTALPNPTPERTAAAPDEATIEASAATTTDTSSRTATPGGLPGFTASLAVVTLLGVALLATRRY